MLGEVHVLEEVQMTMVGDEINGADFLNVDVLELNLKSQTIIFVVLHFE